MFSAVIVTTGFSLEYGSIQRFDPPSGLKPGGRLLPAGVCRNQTVLATGNFCPPGRQILAEMSRFVSRHGSNGITAYGSRQRACPQHLLEKHVRASSRWRFAQKLVV
jgi:hypothetical protein